MTTELHDFYGDSAHATIENLVRPNCPTTVEVNTWRDGTFLASVSVEPSKFLAAVATELDVITINRADLPEVTVSPDGRIQARGATLLNGTATGSDALGWLAINEYLDAHPPVDEAQVDALAKLLAAADVMETSWQGYRDEARRLVAAGVTAPQAGTR